MHHQEEREDWLSKEVPRKLRGLFRAAYLKQNIQDAVLAYCIECFGYDKLEAHTCKSYSCPLWEYGPANEEVKDE